MHQLTAKLFWNFKDSNLSFRINVLTFKFSFLKNNLINLKYFSLGFKNVQFQDELLTCQRKKNICLYKLISLGLIPFDGRTIQSSSSLKSVIEKCLTMRGVDIFSLEMYSFIILTPTSPPPSHHQLECDVIVVAPLMRVEHNNHSRSPFENYNNNGFLCTSKMFQWDYDSGMLYRVEWIWEEIWRWFQQWICARG